MSAIPQFDHAFMHVVGVEGRYSNDPADSGGATMYGITERVARAYGYKGAMSAMPLDIAKVIYRARYWEPLKLNIIGLQAPKLAYELFDSGVNCGIGNAGKWFQRALNGLNLGASIYADMRVDGIVGEVTIAAWLSLVKRRGITQAETAVRRLCDCQQGVYYLELVERREKDERFLAGWSLNRLGGE